MRIRKIRGDLCAYAHLLGRAFIVRISYPIFRVLKACMKGRKVYLQEMPKLPARA